MEQNSIIIIGAGIAGLSAGCYGQMSGYRTQIFEMHDLPGGLCTSWQREGYTIDGCLNWLVGSSPGTSYYRLWQELGAVQGRTMIDHGEFLRVQGREGKVLILYCDLDRLAQHLLELAPQDADAIDELIATARTCARFDPPLGKAPELMGFLDGVKFMIQSAPFLRVVSKWKDVSMEDYAQRFSDPFLREALSLITELPDHPVLAMLMTLGWFDRGTAGYPQGGSLQFSRAIEGRYLELGGEIQVGARVAEILVENDRAVGVRLDDGSTHRASTVISAADGHTTIFELLAGRYVDDEIRGYYDELPVFPGMVQVALGVNRSFEGLPHSVIYSLEPPVTIAGRERDRFAVEIYNFDPALAPPGKTVLKTLLHADHAYWRELQQDAGRYESEKDKVANQVIALLDQRYPGLAGQVEMRDVATPMTWERYTGNWRGSYEGWLTSEKTMPPFRMRKTLPGLEGFYMAGQWVEPGGGVPTVAISGRNVIQIICRRDGAAFMSQKA